MVELGVFYQQKDAEACDWDGDQRGAEPGCGEGWAGAPARPRRRGQKTGFGVAGGAVRFSTSESVPEMASALLPAYQV